MNHDTYILALDQGTSSSRAVLFDRHGRGVGMAQRPLPQIFPQPGWVEHDPDAIWRTQIGAAREVLQRHGVAPSQVAAIGIANQRETTVLWDRRTGAPLANAIVWQDRRTADACERLRQAGHAASIRERTGLVLDAYFSASKLQWMLEHVPGARDLARRGHLAFGTVDSWLAYRLSGAHVTDGGNASRTMLYNLHTGRWDGALLDLFGIPASLLPEVVPSSAVVAHTAERHFGRAIPIAGIAGDQQAATFGQACHRPGMAKNTIGTGSFLLMHTGDRPVASDSALLSTVGWNMAGRTSYLAEGSVFMAGATLQWLCEGLGIAASVGDVEALANSVPDTGGVTMVPAFTGLGAPYWDPHARGAILGLHRGSTAAHIARAALAGIARQCADVLVAMQADAGVALAEMRVDGGGARSNLLLQMMADALGVPVLRPRTIETTALGAAQLAGLAVGYWQSCEEVQGHWQLERAFEPAHGAQRDTRDAVQWRRAVRRTRHWAADDGEDTERRRQGTT